MALSYVAPFLLAAVLLLAGTACAAVDIGIVGPVTYGPGADCLENNLTVTYDELIPKDTTWLYIYFDDRPEPGGEVSLDRYLRAEDQYTFENQSFSYNLTASGTFNWFEYPEQSFRYNVSVEGWCGNDSCSTDPLCQAECGREGVCSDTSTWPCYWSMSRTGYLDPGITINGSEGLKYIERTSFPIPQPPYLVENSVEWSIEGAPDNPPEVELTMRAACGGRSYEDVNQVLKNGWVWDSLTPNNGEECDETMEGGRGEMIPPAKCRIDLGHSFDGSSMAQGYRKYGGPSQSYNGGVYKYVGDQAVYQEFPVDVSWDGDKGTITINNFMNTMYYFAFYLPPNGPEVCAYTSRNIPHSSEWGRSAVETASAGYLQPFTKTYGEAELDYITPGENDCPVQPCTVSEPEYGTAEHEDPSDSVDIAYDYDPGAGTLTVTGTATKKILSAPETFSIGLESFGIGISGLTQELGTHNMTVLIREREGETVYGEETFGLFTCPDSDGDGYCTENGDCNDTNPEQNPDMAEVCNGLDDDCNGMIDDGIAGMGESLGKPCWDWPGSVCRGVYVCNSEGTGIVCLPETGIRPGEIEEICDNYRDDDCDSIVDEKDMYVGGVLETCVESSVSTFCYGDEIRPCGSNIGECEEGMRRCISGRWSDNCEGGRGPSSEVCNNRDDDCNGVVDDILGRGSPNKTACGCTGGAAPGTEICNDIDDDCDGEVDEGLTCCTSGSTQSCGTDVGACRPGIRKCENGQWSECMGSKGPEQELCCDSTDNDCDGEVDEGCSGIGCGAGGAGGMGMVYWTMIGIGAIMLIGLLVYTGFIRKGKGKSVYRA
jgi:hypothetical protein